MLPSTVPWHMGNFWCKSVLSPVLSLHSPEKSEVLCACRTGHHHSAGLWLEWNPPREADFLCARFWAPLLLFSHQHFLVCARADRSKCHDFRTAVRSSRRQRCRAVAVQSASLPARASYTLRPCCSIPSFFTFTYILLPQENKKKILFFFFFVTHQHFSAWTGWGIACLKVLQTEAVFQKYRLKGTVS